MGSGFYFNPPNEGFISIIFFRSMWGLPFANLEAKVSQSLQVVEIFYCFGQGSVYWLGLGHSPPCVQEKMASLLGTCVSGQKWAPHEEAEPSLPAENSNSPLQGALMGACCRSAGGPCGQGQVPSRQSLRAFLGRQPLCGMGVLSVIEITSRPPIVRPWMADKRPGPRPFTTTRMWVTPFAVAFAAAAMPAVCAAMPVPFLAFLNPSVPQEVRARGWLAAETTWICVLL